MNNFKTYLLGILAILTIACSPEDLEFKNFEDINTSIFPSSEEDVEALVISAYYPLRGAYVPSNDHEPEIGQNIGGIHNTSETGLMFMLDATTEILQGPFGIQQTQSYHSYNPTSEAITRFYDLFYNDISNMTVNLDLIANTDISDNIKNRAIAEIKCARALLSYELFDMYGPLVVAPLEILQAPLTEVSLARLSHDEMVSFIEQDLLDAVENLPSPQEANYGRFSQGLARMILIRLYLHEKRWEEVEEQAQAIMDLNYYQLDSDYVGLWDTTAPVESKEIIWVVPADYLGTSENQWQLMVLPANFPGRGGFGTIQSSWQFYDSFEPNDIRRTNLIAEYTTDDGETINRDNPGNIMQLGPLPLKIALDEDRTTGISTVDMIIYRYPDVLLSKAEAIANKTGVPTQEAIDLVNIVRTRAQIDPIQLVDYTDIDTFNTMILLERSHEYWCENGQYRADLIRHGKYTEYANELNGASSESEPYKELFPFSLERISEGKGAFIQNPGYN